MVCNPIHCRSCSCYHNQSICCCISSSLVLIIVISLQFEFDSTKFYFTRWILIKIVPPLFVSYYSFCWYLSTTLSLSLSSVIGVYVGICKSIVTSCWYGTVFLLVGRIFIGIFFMWPIVVCSLGSRYFCTRATVSPGHVMYQPFAIAAIHISFTGKPADACKYLISFGTHLIL